MILSYSAMSFVKHLNFIHDFYFIMSFSYFIYDAFYYVHFFVIFCDCHKCNLRTLVYFQDFDQWFNSDNISGNTQLVERLHAVSKLLFQQKLN